MARRILGMLLVPVMLVVSLCGGVFAAEEAAEPMNALYEAEDLLMPEGGQVLADSLASQGVYALLSGVSASHKPATYAAPDLTLSIETTAETTCYLWMRSYINQRSAGKLWYAVGNGEYEAFHRLPSAEWKWHRLSLGKLPEGISQVKLGAGHSGFGIDQILVTNDKKLKPEGIYVKQEAQSDTRENQYLPANTEAENDTSLPVFEDRNGSYFIEAEDGKIKTPISKFFDETASGETYIAAMSGIGRNLSPESNKPNVTYKFYVKEKMAYKLWIRYYSPDSGKKSCWIGIDGKDWIEHNTSTTTEFKWASKKIFYLDQGWHTIDWQYRECGQKIDCFALVRADTQEFYDFQMYGLGALPGEEVRPPTLTYAQRLIPKLYLNGTLLNLSYDIQRTETGGYVVPIRYLAEKMGVTYYKGDGYILLSKGRNYLKLTPGESSAVTNGKTLRMPTAPYMKDTLFLMDLDSFLQVFGGSYTTEDGVQLNLTAEEETFEHTPSELIDLYNIDSQSVSYRVTTENKNIKIIPYVHWSNETGWRRGTSLTYRDGAFYGSFVANYIADGQSGCVKLKVIDGDKISWHYKNFESVSYNDKFPTVYDFIPHEEGLYLEPALESMSYYLDVDDDHYDCAIYYRVKGEQDWKKAYKPYYDDLNRQFRGVIVYLQEGTEYEVKAELSMYGKTVKEEVAQVKTWESNPPIAKTYKLSEIYDPDKDFGALVLEAVKGNENGWIKIVGDESGDTVHASKNAMSAVYIANSSHIILENIKIQGGDVNGVELACNSENIRIVNCDISGWGRYGYLNPATGMHTDYNNQTINLQGGVKLFDVKNTVIERCYIHDPDGQTNAWTWGHPCGMTGIILRSRGGVVIRYNDIIGSNARRWNDAIECYNNGSITGGPSRDTEIYGNVLIFSNDDAVELDGGQMNARFYNNRIEGTYCGVSTIPLIVGPSYIFNNIMTHLGDDRNGTFTAMKSGGGEGRKWNYSKHYFFQNTVYTTGSCIAPAGWTGADDDAMLNYETRNNIMLSGSIASSYSIRDVFKPVTNSYDYDCIRTLDDTPAQVEYGEGNEQHGVFEYPMLTNPAAGLYTLLPKSPVIDKGVVLDNFTRNYEGEAPDIGALEYGSENAKKSIPERPADIWASQYRVNLEKGVDEEDVTIYIGDIGKEMKYQLLVNKEVPWVTATNAQGETTGTVKPGDVIVVKVTGDTSKNPYNWADGSFLFRLEDGYSIPVSVYAGKY